jgi:hypothetical protein
MPLQLDYLVNQLWTSSPLDLKIMDGFYRIMPPWYVGLSIDSNLEIIEELQKANTANHFNYMFEKFAVKVNKVNPNSDQRSILNTTNRTSSKF